ncbi:lactate dehydrogenase [Vibrio profundum]|uniref:transposase n=1 Tax=Vibrio profundum TaxID=2910247 RepID=UPI003D0F4DCD
MSDNRLPIPAEGLQLNFCKTLACENFGSSNPHDYIFQHQDPTRPTMVCRKCGAFPPLLNNHQVLLESLRLKELHHDGVPSCRNQSCTNHNLPVYTHKHLYHAFGFSGDRQRYRCKQCQATFVDKWSGENPKNHLQQQILAMLFTGYSVREICRKVDIKPKTFYDHLQHIASRCRRRLANFDARWLQKTKHYVMASNYSKLQPNSDNGVFWLVTGEANSGYIYRQHINYSANDLATGNADHDPYQDNASVLARDYQVNALPESNKTADSLLERVELQYQAILARNNVESPLGDLTRFHYPSIGVLIRPQYTSYAHYLNVLETCDENKRLSLFMPQDPLLRSAALSICKNRILQGRVDLMYVCEDPLWDKDRAIEKIDVVHMGWWRDRWGMANQEQAEKGVCYLAGDNPNLDKWLQNASITAILFYQQRFQSLFQAFINEPRRRLRPGGLLPLLDIFQAWHNLCYQDKNGQTAAQKLGLCQHAMTLEELLS